MHNIKFFSIRSGPAVIPNEANIKKYNNNNIVSMIKWKENQAYPMHLKAVSL